ncbi:MAG: tetratricopeptide repeat protein [Thermoanaerobaculia bacterium]|nr:tetratricopeptide repeat protein [Thermoanaerobaculia bacterium]
MAVDPLIVRPSRPEEVALEPYGTEILAALDRALTESGGKRPVLLDMTAASSREELSWVIVLRRLNELRNGIERRFPAPLLLAVTPPGEGLLGREAPDLWSRRGSGMRLSDRRSRTGLAADLGVSPASRRVPRMQLPVSDDPLTSALREIRGGSDLIATGRLGEGAAKVEAALAQLRKHHPDLRRGLAEALIESSEGFVTAGRLDKARRAAEEAVEIYRSLERTQPGEYLPSLADALDNLGLILQGLGRRQEALDASREAVDFTGG